MELAYLHAADVPVCASAGHPRLFYVSISGLSGLLVIHVRWLICCEMGCM